MKQLLLLLMMFVPFFGSGSGLEANDDTVIHDPDLASETVQLNSGWDMPVIGIDLSALTPVQAEVISYQALTEGFRLLDIAGAAVNEEAVGRGIARAIEEGRLTREEIFICAEIRLEEAEDLEEAGDAAIQQSLTRLGLDYIDLMVVSQSRFDLDLAACQALQRAVEAGTVHSIGFSGFGESRNFDLIVEQSGIIPAVLRLETHPYRQNLDMKQHLTQYGTVIAAKDPFGGGDRQVLFADPAVSIPAAGYESTSEQIILHWQRQSGNIAIPAAIDEFQLEEYFDIGDFELNEAEMAGIDALDRGLMFIYY